MLGLTFSSKLVLGSSIILVAKTASKKIEALIRSMNFFLLRWLCIPVNLPYAHAWNTVFTSGLVPLVTLWNCKISYKNRFAGLSIPCLLHPYEPLAHLGNVASLSIFYRCCFYRCSSELAQLVPLPFS